MRREGRLGGKPTNHSRMAGKCRVVNCEQCHESLPLNKSRGKGKGRVKRLVADIPSTHLVSDWRVSRPSTRDVVEDRDSDSDEVEAATDYDGAKEPVGWALSISLLLERALEHIQESVDARCLKAEEQVWEGCVSVASQTAQPAGEDSDDDADVPDLEAFKNELEVLKHEIEARVSPGSVAESADSWFGIEISDAESDLGEWEDDWYLVGDVIAL